jgi:hypothetical protein
MRRYGNPQPYIDDLQKLIGPIPKNVDIFSVYGIAFTNRRLIGKGGVTIAKIERTRSFIDETNERLVHYYNSADRHKLVNVHVHPESHYDPAREKLRLERKLFNQTVEKIRNNPIYREDSKGGPEASLAVALSILQDRFGFQVTSGRDIDTAYAHALAAIQTEDVSLKEFISGTVEALFYKKRIQYLEYALNKMPLSLPSIGDIYHESKEGFLGVIIIHQSDHSGKNSVSIHPYLLDRELMNLSDRWYGTEEDLHERYDSLYKSPGSDQRYVDMTDILDSLIALNMEFISAISRREGRLLPHGITPKTGTADVSSSVNSDERKSPAGRTSATGDRPEAGQGLALAKDEAKKMNDENLKFTPSQEDVPEKTIICEVITDAIVPAGQRDMIQRIGQYMAKPEKEYIERIARLEDCEQGSFIDKLRDVIVEQKKLNPGCVIEYYVACARPGDVEAILESEPSLKKEFGKDLKIRAIAFAPCERDVNAVHVHGIMLALRALRKGPDSLRKAYKILTGKEMKDEDGKDIHGLVEMMKKALFTLPPAKIGFDQVADFNSLIEEYIQTAA